MIRKILKYGILALVLFFAYTWFADNETQLFSGAKELSESVEESKNQFKNWKRSYEGLLEDKRQLGERYDSLQEELQGIEEKGSSYWQRTRSTLQKLDSFKNNINQKILELDTATGPYWEKAKTSLNDAADALEAESKRLWKEYNEKSEQ